jgi:DNA modification methylase
MQESESRELELGWFHRYPARFPASALGEMIASVQERLGEAPQLLLDPFAGTGSTLTAARQLGLPSVGVELTYLGVLIAQVRLAPPNDLERALAIVEEMAIAQPTDDEPSVSVELVAWIGQNNASVLTQWLSSVDTQRDMKLKRWLQLAISSALRPSSRWLPGSIKPQTDPNRVPPPIGDNLKRSARALVRDCHAESKNYSTSVTASVELGDARSLPLETNSVCAVVTSPPYATMYDYYDVQRLSYLAFEWPQESHQQIGQSHGISRDGASFMPPPSMRGWYSKVYRGETTAEGRALRAYLQAMKQHFSEVERVLRSGGVIAYGVADSFKQGRTFRLVEAIAELMAEFSFNDITVEPRRNSNKRILPAGRDPRTGRFSSSPQPAIDEQVIYAVKR